MRKLILSCSSFLIISVTSICGQDNPAIKGLSAINQNVIQSQLDFLASDWMEGRRAGEKGELISSDYIASMLRLYGVKPWGDRYPTINLANEALIGERSYFQNFVLLKTSPGDEQALKLKINENSSSKTIDFTYNVDFSIRPLSSVEIEAPVVFAGYGFKSDKLKFNDLNRLDVKGKFILRISGIPAFASQKLSRTELNSARRALEDFARENGAAGIIDINPASLTGRPVIQAFHNMSPAENNPRPTNEYAEYSVPRAENPNNMVRLSVTLKTANEILRGTGISLLEYMRKADINEPYTMQPVQARSVYLKSTVKTSPVGVRNVLGIIEGNNPDEIIVLGAHYDHVGMNNGFIWNGADDNASGTVGVMTIAKAIMETGQKPDKSIVIALWTAEEEGLLGSEYYIANLTHPLKDLKLNLNFDMISRYISDDQKDKVVMTYTSSNKNFRNITEGNLKKHEIELAVEYQPSDDPPGGSDHRTFVQAGIPVMRFKPGHREEYHTPADEINTIDWDIMEKIVRISFANVWELANTEW